MKKVMVVDDEPAIRETLVDLLTEKEIQVFESATANQALDQATQKQFDLIITDFRMPGIDGLEFMQRLRRMNVHTPVILMTAFANKETIKRALELGAIEFLEKPVPFERIKAVVTGFLRDGKVPPQPAQQNTEPNQVDYKITIELNDSEYEKIESMALLEGEPIETWITKYLRENLLKK